MSFAAEVCRHSVTDAERSALPRIGRDVASSVIEFSKARRSIVIISPIASSASSVTIKSRVFIKLLVV